MKRTKSRVPRYTYTSRKTSSSGGRPVSMLLLIVAVIAVGGVFGWLESRSAPQPTTAKLVVQGGEATVVFADAGSDTLKAGATATLQRGDEVRTAADSRATLTFADGETTELQGKARLTILELQRSAMTRAPLVLLALHEGNSYHKLAPAFLRGMRFEVETPLATVQARGTAFQCQVLGNSRAYVAVSEGVVLISMGEQSLELKAGQASDVYLGQPLAARTASTGATTSAPSPASASPSASPTLTEREKILFPAVETPTRPSDKYIQYTVKQGDTLASIAREYGMSWQALWELNKDVLRSPEQISPGQKLRIPKP